MSDDLLEEGGIELNLSADQLAFLQDTTSFEKLFCAGLMTGKSFAGAFGTIELALINAGHTIGVIEPTWSDVKDVAVLAIRQQLEDVWHIPHEFNKTSQEILIKPHGQRPSLIQPKSAGMHLRGRNWAAAWVDELDTFEFTAGVSSKDYYNEIVQRVRHPDANRRQIITTSTPEGYRFLYEHFVTDLIDKPELSKVRRLHKGSTFNSPFATDEYVRNILANYPPDIAKAYLHGEFVNFEGKTVYHNFHREKNHDPLTLAQVPMPEQLYLGMDFNYAGMSVVAAVRRADGLIVVDELVGAKNTDECIKQMRKKYAGRNVLIHPDPAGNQRKSSAMDTDIAQLRNAGFSVRVMSSHPAVKDRVNSVNALLLSGDGDRRLKVNTQACPWTTKALLRQTYRPNGEPDKKTELGINETLIDGPMDALGYLVFSHFPLRGRGSHNIRMIGM